MHLGSGRRQVPSNNVVGLTSLTYSLPTVAYAPELFGVDDSELQAQASAAGWAGLLTGYTGQCGYNGPVMHPSEYVGGGLERDILADPGWYVVTAVVDDADWEAYGWAVAYLPEL